jgi:hypothetical protein
MARASLLRAASRLLEFLSDPESAVIGGLAVSAHGYIRATRDVDILVSIPLEEARRRLSARGITASLRRGDFIEGEFPVLKGSIDRIPFDIVSRLVPFEPGRAHELAAGRFHLRVVDLETLARLKLKAAAPKDLWDLAVLAHLNPVARSRILELASYHDPELSERFRSFLEDPRAKSEARERARDLEPSRRPRKKKHK